MKDFFKKIFLKKRIGPAKDTPLRALRLVVFDTETTGLNPAKDRILSIGAVGISNLEIRVADSLELYLRQDWKGAEETIAIHGILPVERPDSLPEMIAIQRTLDFFGESVLVGQHVDFDVSIVRQAAARNRLPALQHYQLDTLDLAKRVLPASAFQKKGDHGLDKLCEHFRIPLYDRHTAAGDAFITAQLFLKLVSALEDRGVATLGDLLRKPQRHNY